MKKQIIPKILEILQRQAESTVDLLDIFTSGYSESYRKSRRTMLYGPRQFDLDWAEAYVKRQTFYSLLNKLKNEGLIEKNRKAKQAIWRITKKGLEKIGLYKQRDNFDYPKEKDNKLKLVIFDIPEKERKKRDWLRIVLFNLGFSLLQKSVWTGKIKIPENLLEELKIKEMLSYVHIFEITRRGTITELSVDE